MKKSQDSNILDSHLKIDEIDAKDVKVESQINSDDIVHAKINKYDEKQDIEDIAKKPIDLDSIAQNNMQNVAHINESETNSFNIKIVKLGFIILIIAGYIGVYAGFLLFGGKSIEVIIDLQKEKADLIERIQQNKDDNAKLQKQLLEIKELGGQ